MIPSLLRGGRPWRMYDMQTGLLQTNMGTIIGVGYVSVSQCDIASSGEVS